MGTLRYGINISIDGCCDHQAFNPGQEVHIYWGKRIAEVDAVVYGRKTYELMQAWKFTNGKPDWVQDWMLPFAEVMNAAKKYVVSDSMKEADWNAEIIRSADLEETVRELKKKYDRGLMTGGLQVPKRLVELGLVDEFEFVLYPGIAGHGPYLFEGLAKFQNLKPIARKSFASGIESIIYKPATV
jgi:dihydrofolate reductase